MKLSLLVACTIALMTASAARAHSELPSEDWCAEGRPVPVGSFEVYAETLVADRERDATCSAGGKGLAKDCGQFDDDYETSSERALALCSAHGYRAMGHFGSVIAVVQWPETYLHADHHRLYRAEHGLRGLCVRCERPPRPLPSPKHRD
ncbi:MAG: hypothetical protein ACK5PG_03925 [Lysobacterales bacterium]|jgi:hypothetical protein